MRQEYDEIVETFVCQKMTKVQLGYIHANIYAKDCEILAHERSIRLNMAESYGSLKVNGEVTEGLTHDISLM